MNKALARPISIAMIVLMVTAQNWATCGGGGGGGVGGMGGGSNGQVYQVPWKVLTPKDPPITSGLVLYWFPTSQKEIDNSSLRSSRTLSNYATQCVTMEIAEVKSAAGQKLAADAKLPVAVLATPDGTALARAENEKGFLKVEQVEKILDTEMKKRDEALKQKFEAAKEKAKSGDNAGAIPLYRAVVEEKCLFPKRAKDAAKELKKLGVNDVGAIADPPIFDRAESARIEEVMRRGLKAENQAKYLEAEKLYSQAHQMDPADPVPLRYLGELYRHQTGEWDKARQVFDRILAMQSDPLSRAVALHGLGKMTIHEGEFKKGLALMEDSVRTFPIALAYRNLAVYWNSEGDAAKTDYYVNLARNLDPKDPFNLVFVAGFLAGTGHGDEALKIARENEALLPASYNLAAVYAQLGQREKAINLLQRHFFEYERYQAVRSKEMMEARVDAVFASIRNDPKFIALTSGADGKLPMPGNSTMGTRSAGGGGVN
jgi:tetratricopeptide (TPR) repeat protein